MTGDLPVLTLVREQHLPDRTLGRLYLDRVPLYRTLELPWVDNVQAVSCIPAGTYRLRLSRSARFGRDLPELLGVPGRFGIRIHRGNYPQDSTGCILVGMRNAEANGETNISDSRVAELQLVDILSETLGNNACWFNVKDGS